VTPLLTLALHACSRLDTNRGLYPGTPYEKATKTADGVLIGPQALVTIVNDLPGPLAPLGRLLLKLTGGLTADGIVAAPWVPEVGDCRSVLPGPFC
jgi:hypothetical protein